MRRFLMTEHSVPAIASANAAVAVTPDPWWRVGTVWLVIGGPLAVVVAGVATAMIAWSGADDILPSARPGSTAGSAAGAEVPAVQARNHATTGGQ
jgi:hypothetical protein